MPKEKTKIENLHKNNANTFSRIIDSFEGFAIDDSSAFSRLRASLKETGDMFLFGKPTDNLVSIILKIYHENYIRNLCFSNSNSIIQSSRDLFGQMSYDKLSEDKHISFMCGMIEMDDGEIYMTVSEAPRFGTRVEDDVFNYKEQAMLDILSACNIKYTFPEDSMKMSDKTVSIIKNLHRENLNHKSRWRKYDNVTPMPGILDPSKFADYESKLLISESPEEGSKSGINYDNDLWSKSFNVNIINSLNYLRIRLNEGKSFPPFKKYDSEKQKVECNNGSTCTESKLFSYVYNDLGKTWDDIRGFAVIWVGNKLPPKHIIDGYCYNPAIPTENEKLDGVVEELLRINTFRPAQYTPEKLKKIMKLAGRACALACPGCYSNNKNYRSKEGMETLWDQKGCYTELNTRGQRRTRTSRKSAAFWAAKPLRVAMGPNVSLVESQPRALPPLAAPPSAHTRLSASPPSAHTRSTTKSQLKEKSGKGGRRLKSKKNSTRRK